MLPDRTAGPSRFPERISEVDGVRRGLRIVIVGAALIALAAPTLVGKARADDTADPTAPGPHPVATAEYTLGDTVFEGGELTGVVHYPSDIATGTHPLVLMAHGLFATCADRSAGAADLSVWPCPAGIGPIRSYRGYDYLGRRLASHGIVAVSIGANGINAHGNDFPDRAALMNKHLELWQRFVTTGGGPLAGHLSPDFTEHVDMHDVGTLGHSKGGRGAVYQAADAHQAEWPAGVTVKAVVALAPVISGRGADGLITKIPFLTVMGGCDQVSNDGAQDYFADASTANQVRVYQLLVHGANHNFFNTQWSPSSGTPTAEDDALTDSVPDSGLGRCTSTDPSHTDERHLTENEQRSVGSAYLSAFFRRYLLGDTQFEPMLTGANHPIPGVDVKFKDPS